MIDMERDLRIVVIFSSDLKAYLLNENLYWTLAEPGPFGNPYPMGTLGGLFLRLARLDAVQAMLSADQLRQLDDARARTDTEMDRWMIQAEGMMLREVKARLQSWGAYVREFASEPGRFWNEYATQVENRAILDLLLARGGRALDGQGFRGQIEGLDKPIRNTVQEGPFVWDDSLSAAFSKAACWWLYVEPLAASF
jgi:hypothetical protein